MYFLTQSNEGSTRPLTLTLTYYFYFRGVSGMIPQKSVFDEYSSDEDVISDDDEIFEKKDDNGDHSKNEV